MQNSLDNDGALGGTNKAEAGKRRAGQLALNGEMRSWAADLTLSHLLAPNLELTGVVDADLGLVGLLLDGEGLEALALARGHTFNRSAKIIVVLDGDATASLVIVPRAGTLATVIEGIGYGRRSNHRRADLLGSCCRCRRRDLRRHGGDGKGDKDDKGSLRELHGLGVLVMFQASYYVV